MKTSMALATALAVAALATTCLTAQEPAPAETTLLDEVARLNRTLAQIASLLEKQVESQDTQLLIQRIELSGRSLAPMKGRLRDAREEVTNLEAEEANLVGVLEAHKEEMARQAGTAEGDPYEVMQLTEIERRLETIPGKRQALGREIMELENDVAAREEDLKILKDVIDSRLGLR